MNEGEVLMSEVDEEILREKQKNERKALKKVLKKQLEEELEKDLHAKTLEFTVKQLDEEFALKTKLQREVLLFSSRCGLGQSPPNCALSY